MFTVLRRAAKSERKLTRAAAEPDGGFNLLAKYPNRVVNIQRRVCNGRIW